MSHISIGEFARRSRLPISTLRYYHEVGLLVPARIDTVTNYRYYDTAQIPVAVTVSQWRSVGLSPDQIRAAMSSDDGGTKLTRIRQSLEADLSEQQRRLQLFDDLVAGPLIEPDLSAPRLVERSLAWAATLQRTATNESMTRTVRRGFVKLRRDTEVNGPFAATFPLDLNAELIEIELHIEACDVERSFRRVLATRHTGAHESLWAAYNLLLAHSRQNGLPLAGSVTERYLPPNDSMPVTEVLLHLHHPEETS